MRYVSLQRDTKLSVEITNGDVIQELIAKCCFHVVDFRVKKKKTENRGVFLPMSLLSLDKLARPSDGKFIINYLSIQLLPQVNRFAVSKIRFHDRYPDVPLRSCLR